jgi:hypothetical protein
MAPTKPCVVDMGKPSLVANKTVAPAANATAKTKSTDLIISSGTKPLPEKFFINAAAKKYEHTLPAKVVSVARINAGLYCKVPLPHKVATPLKLSFAPLE